MALINQHTGIYGFTIDGLDGITSDANGNVKKCIFSIGYQWRNVDVDFVISSGADDWGAKMGDGTIIPLSNPKVLYQNRDNSIVEFDMGTEYAANSPCILVYCSDTANYTITNHIGEPRPFTENTLSGHFAFTTEGYGSSVFENGCVDRIIASVSFPFQIPEIEFAISAGDDHWGAIMGDGSIINLRNPEVVATNNDTVVIKFDMETPYPSNSPCLIVYRSANAGFHINVATKPKEFIPVTDITGIPSSIITGQYIDLSSCSVSPRAATMQGISWEIIKGNAIIDNDKLYINGIGDITLKATVIDGRSKDENINFVKEFNINVIENIISITAHPSNNVSLIYNDIKGFISIIATSSTNMLSYKWYRNTVNSISGAIDLNNNMPSYTFPKDLKAGTYYYFCEVISPGATSVISNASIVNVGVLLKGIKITPRPATLKYHDEINLNVTAIPENAQLRVITWESSNVDVIQVDNNGKIYAVGTGSATITAKTDDGKFSDSISINIAEHVPVTHIDDFITEIDNNSEYKLTGTVVPSNATNKDIIWSIVSAGNTGAVISGNTIIASNVGNIIIRATIVNGATPIINYTQDINIKVNQKFIPVENINVELPDTIRVGDTILLEPTIVPTNASNKVIDITIKDAGTTGAINDHGVLTFTNSGKCVIHITVVNGSSPSSDFVKDVTLTVLSKWISVSSIIGLPERFNDVSEALPLNATVYPSNASSTEIIYSLESYPPELEVRLDTNNNLYIDNYEEVEWWSENPDADPNSLSYFEDKWIENITDPIIIGIRVPNGIGNNQDYTTSISIGIQSPERPDVHIPIDSITLQLPSVLRARRPILVNRFNKEPWTATNGPVKVNFYRAGTTNSGFGLVFHPASETEEYWKNQYNISFDEHYDWTLDEYYMYIFEDIDVDVVYSVENGMPDGTLYTSTENITVLPEYLPVKNISNIPLEIPYNTEIQLYPEFDTQFNVTILDTEPYDMEIPSYSDVVWSIIDEGTTGAKLNNGVLSFVRPGTITIQAEVPNGSHEAYTWYGTEHNAQSYIQRFKISIVNAEKIYSTPIVKLSLNNGTVVNITKASELYNLSNDRPSDSYIEAGGVRFRKDQVLSIDFWESHSVTDETIYVEDITLNSNNLELYEATSPEIETSKFDDVVPGTEADGCILIENENSEFNGMYILPDGIFMHPDGTIVRYIGSENDLVLNLKYASNVFQIDPVFINFPIEFVRYDNGYVSIPAGTILDSEGNLIIPNPEYGTNDDYTMESTQYKISIHGIVFDIANGNALLPNGTIIKNTESIKLPDAYIFNYTDWNIIEEVPSDQPSDDIEISIPYGSYINLNNDLNIPNGTKTALDKMIALTSDSGNFIKLSDGSYIYQDGLVYNTEGKLFDVYGNEVTSTINITNNSAIIPSDASNQNIIWSIEESPEGTKLIKIPTIEEITDEESNEVITIEKDIIFAIAGNTAGHLVLNAIISNEFEKKFLINIGDVAEIESRVIAINLNGISKNVYKGMSSTTVSLSASLLGTDENVVNDSISNIEWKVEGGTFGTSIKQSNDKLSATLNISRIESFGKVLTVTVTCGDISATCLINIISKYNSDEPVIESLTNFGRNFSNLTSINHIPPTVNGDDCLRNFLKGCTSFNHDITIPTYIEGDRCLKGFLSGCTSFNKSITIPENVSGTRCLDRFLSGCTSFNKPITIPNNVTGNQCLLRFLEGCISFNQSINIPTEISGKQCLDHFMFGCTSFNKPITIPDGINGEANMRGFMRDTIKMTSDITISEEAANNCEINGLTLVCFTRDDAYNTGIKIVGTGADIFKSKCINMTTTVPLRNLK